MLTIGKECNTQLSIPVEIEPKLPAVEFRIKRTFNGASIFIRSQILEDFFKGLTSHKTNIKTSTNPGWVDKKGYPIREVTEELGNFTYWGNNSLMVDRSYPNMSFFTVYGASKGVEFSLPGLFSDTVLNNFKTSVRKELLNLYDKFMKDLEYSVIIQDFEEE
jgi:hypothetical protein